MNEIVESSAPSNVSVFDSEKNFEFAQRAAKALSSSDLVPQTFKNNVANCMIAIEIANRCKTSPMIVLQNLHIINGRPTWSAQYIIAAVNGSGRFKEPLKFKNEQGACTAWTVDHDGNVIQGPKVTVEMAEAEGWTKKPGSKWKTMPELMLQYRAATFFGRLYCSDILMGMQSEDEAVDIASVDGVIVQKSVADKINGKIKKNGE